MACLSLSAVAALAPWIGLVVMAVDEWPVLLFSLSFPRCFLGPPQNPQILWGEEEGMERAESSPELAEAGTEQSGISSDEAGSASQGQLTST